jgi:hypothetical protein
VVLSRVAAIVGGADRRHGCSAPAAGARRVLRRADWRSSQAAIGSAWSHTFVTRS